MAGGAAFAQGFVLKNERSLLGRMALNAISSCESSWVLPPAWAMPLCGGWHWMQLIRPSGTG